LIYRQIINRRSLCLEQSEERGCKKGGTVDVSLID